MKKALIIVLILVALAFVGQLLWIAFYGKGAALVFAPKKTPVMVVVDGSEAVRVPAGGFLELKMSTGDHSLRLELGSGSIEHRITIKTGNELFGLPVIAEQCFAALDVTASLYKRAAAEQPKRLPHVSKRYREQKPFQIPLNYYYREQDLPPSTKETVGVYLFLTLPCGLLDKSDSELVRALGF